MIYDMAALRLIFMLNYSFILSSMLCTIATDKFELNFNESIANREQLVSLNQRFVLGFFTPSSANNRSYLGIWYKDFPDDVAWVANRENPVIDSPATLAIGPNGKLNILSSTKNVVWSSNYSTSSRVSLGIDSLVVQLLDSGNLVLKQNGSSKYLWQSFDYPGNTLLPGMKIGWDWETGQSWKMISWKDENDPSPGEFTYGMDLLGLPQLVLRRSGSDKKLYRSGTWNGVGFSGMYKIKSNDPVFNYDYTNDTDNIHFIYNYANVSLITKLTLNESGKLQRYAMNVGSKEWTLIYLVPSMFCDGYKACGPNSICKKDKSPDCDCLQGFVPKSKTEWNVVNNSGGCVRRTQLDCVKGDGFLKVRNMKLPDLLADQFMVNKRMSLKECRRECLRTCSCSAYANSNMSGKGSGCLIWFGDLIDVKELPDDTASKQNFYVRLAASELGHDMKNKRVIIISVASAVSGMFMVFVLVCWRIQTLKMIKERNKEDIDLPLFDLATITSATNNFSSTNFIGSGGCGSLYKGKLSTGQEVAVKRLSINSRQGVEQLKNEIVLISKLQHRNLVRTVGYCLEENEKFVVYEYMTNQSLDKFIFGQERRTLNWQNRFDIAMGVAKGLAYLHHDSRLRIIHRDLKASNVLLDNELTPKISDFGIARIFGGDQNEAETKIIIGTFGYMSPEYLTDGQFSTRSDVFSYGVLLLEMVCGKKNTKFRNQEHYHTLLGHAWLLWKEGKALELLDGCLVDSCVESQVVRCIQIGLLCVQRLSKDRPTMSSVVSMLANESLPLPSPKQPGFYIEQFLTQSEAINTDYTSNQVTVTILEPR